MKENGALDPITVIAPDAAGTATPALRTLAACISDGIRYPAVATGLLHWVRHALVADPLTNDVRLLPACGVVHRAVAALVTAWPQVAPAGLALLHQSLALAGTGDAAGRHRDAVIRAVADFAAGGFVLPTLAYVRIAHAAWDLGLLRRFLNSVVGTLVPPFSLPAALELVRLVAACQDRLIRNKRAVVAAGGTGAGIVTTITIDKTAQLTDLLRQVTAAHIKGVGAAVPLPPAPQRTELRALLLQIERQFKDAF